MLDAVIVNPYDIDGTAEATYRALRMPLAERQARNRTLIQGFFENDASAWSASFLNDLKLFSTRAYAT